MKGPTLVGPADRLLALLSIFVAAALSLAATPLTGLHWRSIGPAGAGGRMAAVAGSDRDAALYFAGLAGGGLFRTRNGGLTWDDVWSSQPVASVGAVAIAPSDQRVVWAGTGEPNPRNDASYGDGIWVSHDDGAHWHHAGLERSFIVSRILIDPTDPRTVLVGALGDSFNDSPDRGVYRTTDGGATWRKTLYVGPQSGAIDLAWSAQRPSVVFAAIWQFRRRPWNFVSGGADDGLYRSRDGGVTWSKITGHGFPGGTLGRIGVAVAPSDPQRVYAVVQSRAGTLWRSDDDGSTWRMTIADSDVNQRPFYMSRVAVDPSNRDRIISSSENLLESDDGGYHFHELTGATHQDHHDLWISRDGRRMIEANDGGSPISLDGGRTWDQRFNIAIAQIYHVGFDHSVPYDVCGGMQDNDAFCGPSDSLSPTGILNADWRDVGNDGDGSWVWPDPRDPSMIWNVGVNALNGQLGIYDMKSRQNFDVTPYVGDTNGMNLSGFPYRFNWEAPIAFSPLEPDAAFFGGNVVFKSIDGGRSWSVISPDLTRNEKDHQQRAGGPVNFDMSGAEFYDTILDIAPSPKDAQVIWVGTDDGRVQLTRDSGSTWHDVSVRSIGPYGRVDCVEASPFDAGSAFVVIDRHQMGDPKPYVFATSDFGATWKAISSGLPPLQYAHVVRQDPRQPDVLYLGLEQGIWISFDRGAHWRSLQLDMPTVAVRDMRVQPDANALVVATHGRGFWILDDLSPLQGLASAVSAGAPAIWTRDTTYQYWRWWTAQYGVQAGECCAPPGEFVGENPLPGLTVSYFLPRPQAHTPAIAIRAGGAIAHLHATNVAGISRTSWDLAEDPPVPWNSARDWNKGPSAGPQVVPGDYSITFATDEGTRTNSFVVEPDPRALWTQQEYAAKYCVESELDAELSAIDAELNDLDAHGLQQSAKYRELTSRPVNAEDDLWFPDKLRERIMILQSSLGLSQGPPTPAHLHEAAEIRKQFENDMGHQVTTKSPLCSGDLH